MSRKDLDITEMKIEKWYEQNGKCGVCGKPIAIVASELAHRIPQRRWCLAKWGPKVIHNKKNLVLTCPGDCNSAVSLGNHPVAMEKLAKEIQSETDAV